MGGRFSARQTQLRPSLDRILQQHNIDREPYVDARKIAQTSLLQQVIVYVPVGVVAASIAIANYDPPTQDASTLQRLTALSGLAVGISCFLPFAIFFLYSDYYVRRRLISRTLALANWLSEERGVTECVRPRQVRRQLKKIKRSRADFRVFCLLVAGDISQLAGDRRSGKYNDPHDRLPKLILHTSHELASDGDRRYSLLKIAELLQQLKGGTLPLSPIVVVHKQLEGLPRGGLDRLRASRVAILTPFIIGIAVATYARLIAK